ncbi:unnamed protein product [Microthlaspi erraticum]|uniref:Uncharacterized protein n=1 Tax=Microthlaspi erraticum TaxID=1685480 RepID=A0A6D2JBZ7_9BRAS|nr:unnamed protein product [Microthlaspi erraticum]
MSPSDWFGRFLSLMSSWVSLPDRIRSSWSLPTSSLLLSSWCRCPIGLGLLRLHSVAGCYCMIGLYDFGSIVVAACLLHIGYDHPYLLQVAGVTT